MKTDRIFVEGIVMFIHDYEESDLHMISEAKDKGTRLIGQYSYDKHQPHNPTGEYHLHVYKKGNQIFSINQSGKGHEGYSGTRIPNKAFKALKSKFTDWKWPDNQIIESLNEVIISDTFRDQLRKVKVFKHRISLQDKEGFDGYFHTFADDLFLTGGNGGWKQKTVAIIETEDGYVRKVPVDKFKFIDRD